MDRQENSIEFDLTRYLTKADLKILIDIAYMSSADEKPDDIETIFKKIQSMIPFKQLLFVRHAIVGNSKPSYAFMGFCESTVQDYLSHEKEDPLALELQRSMKFIDASNFYEKNYPVLKDNPVAQIYYDNRLKNGLADILFDHQNTELTALALYGFSSRIDYRIKAISRYLLSFLSVMPKKTIIKEKS
jgi:hypothetical protein